jgi:hypothetical protein
VYAFRQAAALFFIILLDPQASSSTRGQETVSGSRRREQLSTAQRVLIVALSSRKLRSPSRAGRDRLNVENNAARAGALATRRFARIRVSKGTSLVSTQPCALLPTSAEGFVELNYCKDLLQSKLGQVQLRLEQVAIGVQCIELRIHTSAVT